MRDLGRHEFLDKLDAKDGRLDDELLTYLHNAQLKAIFPDSVRRAHKALGEWAKQEINASSARMPCDSAGNPQSLLAHFVRIIGSSSFLLPL